MSVDRVLRCHVYEVPAILQDLPRQSIDALMHAGDGFGYARENPMVSRNPQTTMSIRLQSRQDALAMAIVSHECTLHSLALMVDLSRS